MAVISRFFNETSRLFKSLVYGKNLLIQNLPQTNRIYIGSTAIFPIWAKPIINILVETPKESNLLIYRDLIMHNGYICTSENESRMSFNKGFTESGFAERVFRLHLKYTGDNGGLCLRDYLNKFPDTAKEYERLKLSQWKKYEHNRDAYTNAKTEFVKKYFERAKRFTAIDTDSCFFVKQYILM